MQLLYDFSDRFARRLPSQIRKILFQPANYHVNTDPFIYSTAKMVHTALTLVMNNKIPGDYAEFGVYQGRTTVEACRSARVCGLDIKFHIFDSFAGLPEVKGIDSGDIFETGEFTCSRGQFERNLRSFGVDLSRFNIVEGFYDKTLPAQNDDNRFAVAWIDCDLYESTVPVLEYLTPRLSHGAVVIFDDWFCYDDTKGERRACREWLERNPDIRLIDYQTYHWAGKSFIVER